MAAAFSLVDGRLVPKTPDPALRRSPHLFSTGQFLQAAALGLGELLVRVVVRFLVIVLIVVLRDR